MQIQIKHPIPDGFVPQNTKILIVGTFPPDEQINKKNGFFFYASPRNQFWNRIDNITGAQLKKTKRQNKDLTNEENKLNKEIFAERNNLGFLDVFTIIKRKKKSSKDLDLISVETVLENRKLDKIIKTKPIKRICCTYSLAYDKLKCGLSLIGYSVNQMKDNKTANGEKLEVTGHGKNFEVVLLYPATRSRHKGVDKDNQYNRYLFKKSL